MAKKENGDKKRWSLFKKEPASGISEKPSEPEEMLFEDTLTGDAEAEAEPAAGISSVIFKRDDGDGREMRQVSSFDDEDTAEELLLPEDAFADLDESKEKSENASAPSLASQRAAAFEAARKARGEEKKEALEEAAEVQDEAQKEAQNEAQDGEKEKTGLLNVSVDESSKDHQDERSLTEVFGRNKMIWLIISIGVLLIILVIILFSDRLYNQMEGKASYILTKNDTKVSLVEGSVTVGMYGTQLLRCSQDGLQALTEEGKVVWDIPFTMSAPSLKIAGNFVSVADQLGMHVMVVNGGVVNCEITTESTILLSTVNEIGQTAVVLSASDGHLVNLYSANGELLMQRRTFQTSDGIPLAVALSEDGSRMATVYVNYSGTALKSIITVFDLTESGSLLVDRVIGSVSFDDVVIADMQFVGGGRLFFAGSDRIGVLSTRSGVEKAWENELSYRLEALVMTDDFVAIRYGEGLAGTAERIDKNIVIYNYSGDVISDRYDQDATYLGASGDTVIVGAGRSYTGISSAGSVKWTMDSTEDYMELIAFSSGRTVAALKRTEIDFYDVTLKGAALEED